VRDIDALAPRLQWLEQRLAVAAVRPDLTNSEARPRLPRSSLRQKIVRKTYNDARPTPLALTQVFETPRLDHTGTRDACRR